ncbi:MAG TPA: hypothetical protein VFZ78_01390 [Flavisolibacter sp.]
MNLTVSLILGSSILVAAVILAVRLGWLHPRFLPFVCLVFVGVIAEVFNSYMVLSGNANIIVINIYSLFEAGLIAWQFDRWGLFGKNKLVLPTILGIMILVWVSENFIWGSFSDFNSIFIVACAYPIVIASIAMINSLLSDDRQRLNRNPIFVICIAFIFYFTYTVLVETFWFYGFDESPVFAARIYNIFFYVNFLTNILYAVAALWIPRKPNYILPY